MVIWTKKEINFLKKSYKNTLNLKLCDILCKSRGSINYMAIKLNLKKDYDFYCKSRKKYDKDFPKLIFEKLYLRKGKSIREIAVELGLSKNAVDYYLKKFNISCRSRSEASKLRAQKYPSWRKGLNKKSDIRIYLAAEKSKKTSIRNRNEKLKKVEKRFNNNIKDIIYKFYWQKGLNQKQIADKLNLSRDLIICLMKELEISKRLNFYHISNLRGKKHSQFGKKWEEIYGIEKAKLRRKEFSLRAQKNIIRRLSNNKMPFLNTKIEKKVAMELTKRGIIFVAQYPVDNKFVCDFAVPVFDIIIECDGDYWHANPAIYDKAKLNKIQKRKVQIDKFKDVYLTKRGWKVFRFFESKINKSVKICVDEIEKEIKNQLKAIKNPLDSL